LKTASNFRRKLSEIRPATDCFFHRCRLAAVQDRPAFYPRLCKISGYFAKKAFAMPVRRSDNRLDAEPELTVRLVSRGDPARLEMDFQRPPGGAPRA
jgi:hypothetical protein